MWQYGQRLAYLPHLHELLAVQGVSEWRGLNLTTEVVVYGGHLCNRKMQNLLWHYSLEEWYQDRIVYCEAVRSKAGGIIEMQTS